MGRYHAPQVNDNDDDDQMDSEIIPDDAEEQHVEVPNVARMVRPNDDVDDDDGDDGYHGSQTGSSALYYYTTAPNIQGDELSHRLLELRGQCRSRTKRSAVITRALTIIAVAITSVVLNRYAPPPPPLLNRSPFDTSMLSTDYSVDITADYYTEKHLPDQMTDMTGVTQHETWAGYSGHLIYLVYNTMAYVPSVAWYALSNSFQYAWDEIRDNYFNCWGGRDSDMNENLPRTYLEMEELVSSISSMWSQFIKISEGNSNSPTDVQNRKEDYIKIYEVSEHPICHSARCTTTRCDDTTTSERNLMGRWSTEDYLRQTIGTSLPPQNMALKIIAELIDAWGLSAQSSTSSVGSSVDEDASSRLILPPAIGLLLVGPEGVGKMRIARQLAYYLLREDCSDDTSLSRGVLEVFVVAPGLEKAHSTRKLIVDHIRSREGLGSVIIIHHIESIPGPLVADISHIIRGKYHSLSYQTPNNLVEASCNGTVFIVTSRRWGTSSIFQIIKQNGGLSRLRSESLIKTIRREVEDAHVDYLSELFHQATIAPVLPFQQEDLSSILHGSIQAVNLKYQGIRWERLEVSLAAIRYFVGLDHVKYSDLFHVDDKQAKIDENETTGSALTLFSYSTRGAHALDRNALLEAIQSMSITGLSSVLKIGLDDLSKEATFRLCHSYNGLESCDVEWRSFLV
jgi:hypothetical protein